MLRREILPGLTGFAWTPMSVRQQLESVMEPPERPGLAPVMSSEDLSGFLFDGRRMARTHADLLQEIFPAGRILIVVRDQRSMLRSIYGQYLKMGGAQSLARFLTPVEGPVHLPGFHLDQLRYDELVSYYQHRFGRERVRVMLFEQLTENAAEFLSEISRFGGAPKPGEISGPRRNRSFSPAFAELRRRLNGLLWYRDLNPAPLLNLPGLAHRMNRGLGRLGNRTRFLDRRARERIDREIARHCSGRLAESNRRLAEIADLELARYRYPM